MKLTLKIPPAGRPGRIWFFGVCEWQPGRAPADSILYINGRRMLTVFALFVSFVWCGGAGALRYILESRGYPSVGYGDLVFPWNWSQVPAKQAGDLLVQARRQMIKGDALKALWNAKAAIRKDSTRMDAYSLVGLICARNWLMADARQYLLDGLEQGEPSFNYLQLVLEVAQASDDPDTVLLITDRYWKSGWHAQDNAGRLLLAGQRARALLQLKRWNEALDWARELRQLKERPLVLVDVEAYSLLKLGRAEEARKLLSQVPKSFALQHDGVIRLFAEIFHNLGDLKSFRLFMQLYYKSGGEQPGRHLEVLNYCIDKPDLATDFEAGMNAYYERFGAREEAMGQLGQFLLRHKSIQGLSRLYKHAQTHLFVPGLVDVCYAESLVYTGKLEEASTVLNRLPKFPDNSSLGTRISLLRRLIEAQASESSKAATPLANFVATHPLSLDDTLSLVDFLSQRGLFDEAGRLLESAAHNYPHSQRLSERTERYKSDRNALREAAERR